MSQELGVVTAVITLLAAALGLAREINQRRDRQRSASSLLADPSGSSCNRYGAAIDSDAATIERKGLTPVEINQVIRTINRALSPAQHLTSEQQAASERLLLELIELRFHGRLGPKPEPAEVQKPSRPYRIMKRRLPIGLQEFADEIDADRREALDRNDWSESKETRGLWLVVLKWRLFGLEREDRKEIGRR